MIIFCSSKAFITQNEVRANQTLKVEMLLDSNLISKKEKIFKEKEIQFDLR